MPDSIISEARERFKESEEGSHYNRNNARDDIRFARLAEQWPENVKKLRRRDNRPMLTINRLPSFIRQVVNEARNMKPGIEVDAVDSGADRNTAQVIGGIIRSIERRSHASVAYDTAVDHSVTNGFGFFRLGIDYVSPDSFDMEARIYRVANPLLVHWDTASTEFDASDWDYAFVSDFMTETQFEGMYPEASKVSFEGDDPETVKHWMDGNEIRVAEFWKRDLRKRKVYLLSNGSVVRADKFDEMADQFLLAGVMPIRERMAEFHEVKRHKINGSEELEEPEDWPGSMIPICPVWGEEVISEGRRWFRSMIRDMRDPQSMLNFWRTSTTELVALAPKAPYLVPQGAIPEEERTKWELANTRSYAYLEYDATQGAPQRQPFAGIPAGALQEALTAADDLKSISSLYDPSLGADAKEKSGKAIMARQRQSNISNFHFIDNLARAIEYAGRCLVEIIPHVYSARETIRILGEDRAEDVAKLTSMNPADIPLDEDGKPTMYNLSVGRYDVTVKQGPSFATQREETREMLIEMMRAVPAAAPIVGPFVMDNMDFVGADKLAEALRVYLASQNPALGQALGVQPQQMPGMVPAGPNGVGMTPNPLNGAMNG